jgi:hypothetical protein
LFWSVCYLALRCVLQLVLLRPRSEESKELEILELRHELSVLSRQVRRPEFTSADRMLLTAASRLLPRSRWSSFAVTPATLLREPARFSVYRWVVRCCRGCCLRSGFVGLPSLASSCNRCAEVTHHHRRVLGRDLVDRGHLQFDPADPGVATLRDDLNLALRAGQQPPVGPRNSRAASPACEPRGRSNSGSFERVASADAYPTSAA